MATMSLPAFDPRSLDSLRQAARRGESPETIRASAQQFEALMLQQMLKAMRATVPRSELTDSSERRTYEELADQQLASDLAQRGGVGLAKALERQWLPRTRQDEASAAKVAASEGAGATPSPAPGDASPSAPVLPNLPRGGRVSDLSAAANQALAPAPATAAFGVSSHAAMDASSTASSLQHEPFGGDNLLLWVAAQREHSAKSTAQGSQAAVSGRVTSPAVPAPVPAPVPEGFSAVPNDTANRAEGPVLVHERSFERLPRRWWQAEAALKPVAPAAANVASASSAPAAETEAATPQPVDATVATLLQTVAASRSTASVPSTGPTNRQQAFIDQLMPAAQRAAQRLGVPPEFLIAQAALETGWGQAMLRRSDGSPSHNLFNLKAGNGWDGDTVRVRTTEYRNGRPQTEWATFRAYPNLEAAFDDYVRYLENSRFAAVRGSVRAEQFARRLQENGYATDPRYGEKLVGVIRSVQRHSAVLQANRGTEIAQSST